MRIVQILSHVRPTLLISARMIISGTVEYKQLTICTVYSVQLGQTMFMKQICILTVNCAADYKQLTICTVYSVQLSPNHETNLHLKVLGLVQAKV